MLHALPLTHSCNPSKVLLKLFPESQANLVEFSPPPGGSEARHYLAAYSSSTTIILIVSNRVAFHPPRRFTSRVIQLSGHPSRSQGCNDRRFQPPLPPPPGPVFRGEPYSFRASISAIISFNLGLVLGLFLIRISVCMSV